MDALERVVRGIEKTGIIHLDLRPSNILWKAVNRRVQLKIVDCDWGIVEGEPFPTSLVNIGATGKRYPDLRRYRTAKEIHNWFVESIREFFSVPQWTVWTPNNRAGTRGRLNADI